MILFLSHFRFPLDLRPILAWCQSRLFFEELGEMLLRSEAVVVSQLLERLCRRHQSRLEDACHLLVNDLLGRKSHSPMGDLRQVAGTDVEVICIIVDVVMALRKSR